MTIASRSGGPAPSTNRRNVWPQFYWETEELGRDVDHESTLEDEGFLALDLNRGVAILRTADEYEPLPPVSAALHDVLPFEAYSDAVAVVLQVAAWHGLDPSEVCEQAMATRRAVFTTSLGAAADRARRGRERTR